VKCAYSGIPISDPADGVWDDGEWISWGYIHSLIEDYDEEENKPLNECSYEELLWLARDYDPEFDGHFPIYGEVGELYVESRFGMVRHAPYTQGSDGKIGNHFVEVKTISPLRDSRHVRVKRSGNFSVLAIVKIDADFRIDAKLIKRSSLPKGDGKRMTVSWDDYGSDHVSILEAGVI